MLIGKEKKKPIKVIRTMIQSLKTQGWKIKQQVIKALNCNLSKEPYSIFQTKM